MRSRHYRPDLTVKLDLSNVPDTNVKLVITCLFCGRELHHVYRRDRINIDKIEAHYRPCRCILTKEPE